MSPTLSHLDPKFALIVVHFDLQTMASEAPRYGLASLFVALKANGSTLVLAHVTNLDGELVLALGKFLEPAHDVVEFVAIIVVKDDAPFV